MKTKTATFNFFRRILKFRPLENILRKTVSGKSPNSLLARVIPNNYQYSKGSWREFKKDGILLRVDIYDYVGHYIYFQFKDLGQDRLLLMANKNDYVLDIGTNIGSTLLSFANKIGNNGRVFGFEPDKLNYDSCLQNIKLNDFENIQVSNIGLGDSCGKFKMVTDTSSNRGMNRISYSVVDDNVAEIQVETLDKWLEINSINRIDLIKMDVEGFELKVLKGGKSSILSHTPRLFIELDDNHLKAVGDSATSLVKFLKEDLKYKQIRNAETGEIISPDYSFTNCHFDLIAENN